MIRTKPMGHQSMVLKFAGPLEYAGVFADYGTGKTLMALMLTQLKKFRKVLIVAPKTAIDTTWKDQIREHSDFRFCVLKGTAKQKVNMLQYAVGKVDQPNRYGEVSGSFKPMLFLINYEGIESIYHELKAAEFDACFADESTKIKTYDSKRTMAMQELGPTVKHRYLLVGFPATESLYELYSQVKFLDGGKTFGHSYHAFLNKYFVRLGPKMIIKKRSIKQIMDLIKPFCIRITNDTLKLPPKVYKPIEVPLTAQQRELLTRLSSTFRLELGKVKIDTQYIFALLAKSLEICNGFVHHVEKEIGEDGKPTGKILSDNTEIVDTNKDEMLIEILDEIDVRQHKVVIWAPFRFSVKKIAAILKKLRIPVLTLTGETEDPNKVVSLFQNTKEYNVLVCTQKKAAESITLTAARYAIYYSNVWSNEARLNSEARIRRKGSEKHKSIMYIDLVTESSVEKQVYECLRKKKSLIDELKSAFATMKVEE